MNISIDNLKVKLTDTLLASQKEVSYPGVATIKSGDAFFMSKGRQLHICMHSID